MRKWRTMQNTVLQLVLLVGLVGPCSVSLGVANDSRPATSVETEKKQPVSTPGVLKKNKTEVTPLNSERPGKPMLAKPMSFGEIFQVMSGLVLVIVLIVGMMWLLKRFGGFTGSTNRNIRLIGGINVGTREKIVLVQIGDEQIVLGIAPGSVRKIHILSENIDTEETQEASDGSFSEKLKKAFGQGHRG